ncbi:hypothetical protein RDV84_04320 [Lysobacter yananisis]|uniref:Uncharacterized protein n=1 Tax=Lysobacter yananisis TaxID=1003114 RepID=A0ABY9PAU3_9GAMM|nr:hypothetical protein [Lysobacter yananisis]WMT04084.1 hypothetical protein RDV84_04320 [Lysobacter yananisis]
MREQRAAVVFGRAQAAVHRLRRVRDGSAEDVRLGLMAEADAQHRHAGAGDRFVAHAHVRRALGAPGSGRDNDRAVCAGNASTVGFCRRWLERQRRDSRYRFAVFIALEDAARVECVQRARPRRMRRAPSLNRMSDGQIASSSG